jgi:hypothetical protein
LFKTGKIHHLLTGIFSLSLLIASCDPVRVQYFHSIFCIISYSLGFFLNMYTLYAPCGPKIGIINIIIIIISATTYIIYSRYFFSSNMYSIINCMILVISTSYKSWPSGRALALQSQVSYYKRYLIGSCSSCLEVGINRSIGYDLKKGDGVGRKRILATKSHNLAPFTRSSDVSVWVKDSQWGAKQN